MSCLLVFCSRSYIVRNLFFGLSLTNHTLNHLRQPRVILTANSWEVQDFLNRRASRQYFRTGTISGNATFFIFRSNSLLFLENYLRLLDRVTVCRCAGIKNCLLINQVVSLIAVKVQQPQVVWVVSLKVCTYNITVAQTFCERLEKGPIEFSREKRMYFNKLFFTRKPLNTAYA